MTGDRPEGAPPLVVICGPTASGKTSLVLELARYFDLEVVSADSRQVYRGMDIGTAKATPSERDSVPHHLIDVVDPDDPFTVSDFIRYARKAIAGIGARGRLPFLVGGTGLYIKTLTEGLVDGPPADETLRNELRRFEEREGEGSLHRRLSSVDPELASRLSIRDVVRIIRGIEVYELTGRPLSQIQKEHAFAEKPYRLFKIGLFPERDILYDVIDRRVDRMIAAGLEAEMKALLAKGYSPSLKAFRTIGYREMIDHLLHGLSIDEAIEHIQRNTRRYAKRQLTWFRNDKNIKWLETQRQSDNIKKWIERFYANNQRSGHAQDPI